MCTTFPVMSTRSFSHQTNAGLFLSAFHIRCCGMCFLPSCLIQKPASTRLKATAGHAIHGGQWRRPDRSHPGRGPVETVVCGWVSHGNGTGIWQIPSRPFTAVIRCFSQIGLRIELTGMPLSVSSTRPWESLICLLSVSFGLCQKGDSLLLFPVSGRQACFQHAKSLPSKAC